MLYQYIRLFDSDNGVLTDLSLDNQEEGTNLSLDLVTAEDYLYIGQSLPFNNLYALLGVANSVACTINIEYWDSLQWRSAVDVLDGTATAGVPLSKSGAIQFSPDRDHAWTQVWDTTDNGAPAELSGLTMYNHYWIRLSYTETLTPETELERITYAFTSHQQIDNLDTTINEYLTDFESGKTSWQKEIITASIQVVADLRGRGLIVHPGQVLRIDDISMATDWRTLVLLYRNLGGDYKEKLAWANEEYAKALMIKSFSFDRNRNARVDPYELKTTAGRMVR